MQNNSQKGTILYLSLIILAILLTMVFGITTIIVTQLETISDIGLSVVSLYAADTGIEETLYNRKASYPNPPSNISKTLSNGASYQTIVYPAGDPNCPTSTAYSFCVESTGQFKGIKRSLRVNL